MSHWAFHASARGAAGPVPASPPGGRQQLACGFVAPGGRHRTTGRGTVRLRTVNVTTRPIVAGFVIRTSTTAPRRRWRFAKAFVTTASPRALRANRRDADGHPLPRQVTVTVASVATSLTTSRT